MHSHQFWRYQHFWKQCPSLGYPSMSLTSLPGVCSSSSTLMLITAVACLANSSSCSVCKEQSIFFICGLSGKTPWVCEFACQHSTLYIRPLIFELSIWKIESICGPWHTYMVLHINPCWLEDRFVPKCFKGFTVLLLVVYAMETFCSHILTAEL